MSDHFGNMKTKVSGGNTTTFGWSFVSELLSIDYPGTSNDDSHEYDGHGLRMRSKLAGAANWTNFVWDELTQELLSGYTLISGTYTIKALKTYGLGLISSNREGTKRYFHFDALGSTAALDDESENLKDSYTYEAFGVVQSSTSTNGPSVNPFRFVGQWGYYDDGAMGSQGGVIFLRARYLSIAHGRFQSADADERSQRYVYVGNSVAALIDPSGKIAVMPDCDSCPPTPLTGRVRIGCSCYGKVMWIIPEHGSPYTGPPCGTLIDGVDAIIMNGETFKVGGGNCVMFECVGTDLHIRVCSNRFFQMIPGYKFPKFVPWSDFAPYGIPPEVAPYGQPVYQPGRRRPRVEQPGIFPGAGSG